MFHSKADVYKEMERVQNVWKIFSVYDTGRDNSWEYKGVEKVNGSTLVS